MTPQVQELLDDTINAGDWAMGVLVSRLAGFHGNIDLHEELFQSVMNTEPYREKILSDMVLGALILRGSVQIRADLPSFNEYWDKYNETITKLHNQEFADGLLSTIPRAE